MANLQSKGGIVYEIETCTEGAQVLTLQSLNGGFTMLKLTDADEQKFKDTLISDFTDPIFRAAFQAYFTELDIRIKNWDGLFQEMNTDGGNKAFVRTDGIGNVVGFIQCKPILFTSCFFEETYGFIREFWVSPKYRNSGHGSALLQLAEVHFKEQGIFTSILTTDTAERFYLKHGYQKAWGIKAKNKMEVFIKRLG